MTELDARSVAALGRLAFAIATADPRRRELAFSEIRDRGVSDLAVSETILQGVPYSGFPGAIEAMSEWRESTGSAAVDGVDPTRAPATDEDRAQRGREVFRSVYGRIDARVLDRLKFAHPRLEEWILDFAYGRVMTRGALSLSAIEALGVAHLLGQGRPSPLRSHLRGALRNGWSADRLREFVRAVEESSEGGAHASIFATARSAIDELAEN